MLQNPSEEDISKRREQATTANVVDRSNKMRTKNTT